MRTALIILPDFMHCEDIEHLLQNNKPAKALQLQAEALDKVSTRLKALADIVIRRHDADIWADDETITISGSNRLIEELITNKLVDIDYFDEDDKDFIKDKVEMDTESVDSNV